MKEKVIEVLRNIVKDEFFCASSDGASWDWESRDKTNPVKMDGLSVYCVDRVGGSEGEGEEHYIIVSVTDKNKVETFWKVPGWYASHDRAHLDYCDAYEVQPVEKTIIDWEAK